MRISLPYRVVALVLMTILLMGQSKCEKPVPPAANLLGDWKWSCTAVKSDNPKDEADENSQVNESIIDIQAVLSCAQQTPDQSPFLTYVKEHIRFSEDPNTPDSKEWLAFFSYGTCVDTQNGKYTYAWNKQTSKHELTILDKQGQVSQVYNVEKIANGNLRLYNESKDCQLASEQAPEVKKGNHPRPLATTIEWELRENGGVMLWESSAQFPFVYQSPQLQSRVTSPTNYRVEYSVLHIKIDGSELPHYAAFVQLYDNNSNSLLGISEMKELSNGASFNISVQAPGSHVKLTGTFIQ